MNEMKGEKVKNMRNKGITLIALVITIIVLLILAAVSIATLTGENGILTRANESKTETEIGEEEEAIRLAYNGVMADNLGDGVTAKQLENEMKANGYDVTAEEVDGKIKVTFGEPSNRVYEIDANGNIKEAGTGENPGGGDTTGSVKPGEIVTTTTKNNYTDAEKNTATVPAGFVVSKIPEEQKISSGLVIYDIPENKLASVDWTAKNDDGAYNVQTLYNQFVWIPVATGGEYIRDFSYPSYYDSNIDYTPEGSTFTDTEYLPNEIQETIPEESKNDAESNEEAERNAVMKYNGFYIARYEAGKDTDGTTVISKQDATVYTNETQTEFKEDIGKSMYNSSNSTAVRSAMCSGIQWDMAMKFVDGKNDAKGNTYNVRVYYANRHTGSKTTAGKNEYDKVQNIYDLEGNCYEYVAEKNNISGPFVPRGGYYFRWSDSRASLRSRYTDYATDHTTFRPALYIM